MSRQKKSRKPAPLGPSKAPRLKKEEREQRQGKKPKGRKPGSRNNPIVKKNSVNQNTKSTDPRHGSKKAIDLNPENNRITEDQTPATNFEPQVKLVKVKPEGISPEQELEQIENDQRLIDLLDRADSGEILKGKDAKYFNAKTARHQQLLEILGLDQEDWEDEDDFDDDFDSQQASSLIEQWEADDHPNDEEK